MQTSFLGSGLASLEVNHAIWIIRDRHMSLISALKSQLNSKTEMLGCPWADAPVAFWIAPKETQCRSTISPQFSYQMGEQLTWLKVHLITWEQRLYPPFFYSDVWVMSESDLICLSQIWVKKETKRARIYDISHFTTKVCRIVDVLSQISFVWVKSHLS